MKTEKERAIYCWSSSKFHQATQENGKFSATEGAQRFLRWCGSRCGQSMCMCMRRRGCQNPGSFSQALPFRLPHPLLDGEPSCFSGKNWNVLVTPTQSKDLHCIVMVHYFLSHQERMSFLQRKFGMEGCLFVGWFGLVLYS